MKLTEEQRTSLGHWLRSMSVTKGVTQDELAERTGIDRSTISKVWRGVPKRTHHYEVLAREFGEGLLDAIERASALGAALKAPQAGAPDEAATAEEEDERAAPPRARKLSQDPIVIAVASQKGGTGKTTCAVNLAYEFAQRGHAALLVDFDPQGDATIHSGLEPAAGHWIDAVASLREARRGEVPAVGLEVTPTAFGYDLITAGHELEEAAARAASFPVSNTVLRKLLAPLRERWDVILIDCQPTGNVLQRNAIVAATHLLFPVQMQFQAINGLDRMWAVVDQLAELNPSLSVLGSVPCIDEPNTNLSREAKSQLHDRYYAAPTKISIPKAVSVGEAYAAMEPLGAYDRSSKAALAFRRLAKELEGRIVDEGR
jgi:chromosome partitioning protein